MLECREGEEGVAERPATAGEWGRVRWMEEGEEAVRRVGEELGLWFDRWDMEYYRRLFCEELRRNPTTVELFDLSQSNSEHARHWFFKGVLRIGGEEMGRSLMELVSETLERNRTNSLVAYSDNASVVRGFRTVVCEPSEGGRASRVEERSAEYDVTFTAETHNFPTGVAPYPGAETGVGGRIRDGHAVGRGSVVVGGTAGYAVGQLRVPGYELEWEEGGWGYPGNVASPLEVLIGASNGASDYANRFGEPLIAGYARAFGAVARGERREYVKPIMFSGGLGQIERGALRKGEVRSGMLVVKIGGPAYRIGIGGGAASSQVHGENREELDFNAVQRGDAEMEQRVDRVVRACARMGRRNPIVSIHDQGSGGNANVLKELVGALGARIEVDRFPLGDETLSTLEIWCAEYQENDAVLIEPESEELFASICERERCPYACVGRVSGDGRVVLVERGRERDEEQPYCLPQEKVLGGMPRKVFESEAFSPLRWPLSVPAELEVGRALRELVLPHVEVGSKRFLTSKVDRSVTGLVVQQPCVGPLHVPVADCGI
ncbi:uncharacterized protein LOC126334343, partial [Schistocerca gregaria]|uniref:uncharacterized protein LOC126334343 n=1 Tax=Schistocerca gregaria TaxID=7010 RepID=UPI00211E8E03